MRAVISVLSLNRNARGTASRLKHETLRCRGASADAETPDHHDGCLRPDEGETRSALLAKKDKPFQSIRHFRRRRQKSPLRRCFKPRPPSSTGCAGFASGCRSPRRPVGTSGPSGHLARKRAPFRRRLSGLLPGPHRSTRSHRHVRNWARNRYVSQAVPARQLDDSAAAAHRRAASAMDRARWRDVVGAVERAARPARS